MISSFQLMHFSLIHRLRALSGGGGSSSVASPPLSPALPKYKLADYRYGREEMLALYVKDNKVDISSCNVMHFYEFSVSLFKCCCKQKQCKHVKLHVPKWDLDSINGKNTPSNFKGWTWQAYSQMPSVFHITGPPTCIIWPKVCGHLTMAPLCTWISCSKGMALILSCSPFATITASTVLERLFTIFQCLVVGICNPFSLKSIS